MNELNNLILEVAAKDVAWPVLPIIMADMQTGEIIYASAQASSLFAYTPDEIMGCNINLLIAGGRHAAPLLVGIGRKVQGKRKCGSTFPVHVGLTPVTALGRTIGIAFVVDLSIIQEQEQE